jgi:predicted DNA-binding transcriptional regulator AlpA
MTANPIYLNTQQAAERIGLAKSTLDKMRVKGDGPRYLRAGSRKILYSPDTLDAWLRQREHGSTSEYVAA